MAQHIRDVMTSDVIMLKPDQPVVEAAVLMKDNDIGVLPVYEGDSLVGMVTDRDIVIRTLAEARDPSATAVSDVMNDKIYYCFDDQTADEVAENMGRIQVRRLPVMNRDKRLVGIVSLGDISTNGSAHEAGEALEDISKAA